MAQLTKDGLVIERLDTILADLCTGFKAIYGSDIDLAPDSPDGQLIGLIGQIRADLEELADTIYRSIDPDLATGVHLERVAAFAGINRRRASYSYLHKVVLTGEPHTRIAAGAVVVDPTKQRWILTQAAQLNENGSAQAEFRSDALGAFSLAAHMELDIETITLGWEAALTTEPAEVGVEEETDPQLRKRFLISRAKTAQNSVDGMVAQIGQLTDVKQVVCLENMGDTVDDNQVPGHSINVIVDGGLDEAIAQTIYQNKTGGTGMMGETEVALTDAAGYIRQVRFDRPALVDVYVYLEIERNVDFTAIDVDAIKAAVAATTFRIGEDVLVSRLYSPINTVEGFWVKTLRIGCDSEHLSSDNVSIDVREIARFVSEKIEVIVL